MNIRAKRVVVILAFAATVIVLFYAEEDWRGARELARVRKEIQAGGESLDTRALIPPPIPDALNVAAAPIFAELYEKDNPVQRKTARLAPLIDFLRPRHDVPPPPLPSDEAPVGFSPRDWQKWLVGPADPSAALADVRAELEKLRPIANEVEAALARPGVRWPVTRPENPFAERLPYLNANLALARFFELRSLVEIEEGDGEAALRDLVTIFRLSDVTARRFLVGALVGISCDRHAYGLLAHGLAKSVWNDAQLARIDAVLGRKNHLDDFREAIRQERLSAIRFQEMPYREQFVLIKTFGPSDPPSLSLSERILWSPFFLRPRGWSDLDQAFAIQVEQEGWIGAVDPDGGTVDVDAVSRAETEIKKAQESKWNVVLRPFSMFTLPALSAAQMRAAVTQATLNEAKAACAMERGRLRTGSLPSSLDGVISTIDPIGGAPLHYVPKEGGYLLYSIGWNQRDDGGRVVPRPRSNRPDPRQGDWVWASRPDLYKFVPAKGS